MKALSYVDHRTKSVFNGSDLGKRYSAKGIQDRCKQVEKVQSVQAPQQQDVRQVEAQNQTTEKEQKNVNGQNTTSTIPKPLEELLQPCQSNNYLPHQLKKTKKKKRKSVSNKL